METLHPLVIYYKNGQAILHHKSFVIESNESSHDSCTMTTLIHKIVPEILTLFPTDLKYIHYWTYSPTSQYRDKNAFSFISNHRTMLVSQQPATTLRQATDMAHAVVPVAQHKINAA